MNKAHAKTIFSNASFLVSAQLAARILRGFYIVLLIRYLGPELYGVFQYTQNWFVTFTPFTLFGIGALLSREIGKNKNNGRALLGTTLFIRFIASLLFAAAALSLGLVLEPDPNIRNLMFVLVALIMGRALVTWAKEVFIAHEKTQYHLVQVILTNTLQIVLGVSVMIHGGGVVLLAASYILSLFLEFLCALAFIHYKVAGLNFDLRYKKVIHIVKQGFAIGLMYALMRWMLIGPVVLARYMVDYKHDLGQISLVLVVVFFMSLIVDAVLHAALPILSRIYHQQQGGSLAFINLMLPISLPLSIAIALLGVEFGQVFIPFVFGDLYQDAGALMGAALWLLLPYIWITALSQVFILKHDTTVLSIWCFIGALWMTGLMPVFMYQFGVSGSIYSVQVGLFISAIAISVVAHRKGYVHMVHMGKACLLSVFFTLLWWLVL